MNADKERGKNNQISSEGLAAIIIDALVDAEIVKKGDVPRAIEIAVDEIEVRKQLGDY